MRAPGTRIGVISDTHGLLRPEAARALRGSELILHAGDVCGVHVLEELQAIAPAASRPVSSCWDSRSFGPTPWDGGPQDGLRTS